MTIYDHAEERANHILPTIDKEEGESEQSFKARKEDWRREWDHVFLHEAVMEMDKQLNTVAKVLNRIVNSLEGDGAEEVEDVSEDPGPQHNVS